MSRNLRSLKMGIMAVTLVLACSLMATSAKADYYTVGDHYYTVGDQLDGGWTNVAVGAFTQKTAGSFSYDFNTLFEGPRGYTVFKSSSNTDENDATIQLLNGENVDDILMTFTGSEALSINGSVIDLLEGTSLGGGDPVFYGIKEYFGNDGTVTLDFDAEDNLSFSLWVKMQDNVPPPSIEPGDTTPEPATLALFGFGLAGLGLAARRRRK